MPVLFRFYFANICKTNLLNFHTPVPIELLLVFIHFFVILRYMLNFEKFDVLTFDCYGTLIDWEKGILSSLKPVLNNHGIEIGGDEILEIYSALEAKAEGGEYQTYKSVLRSILRGFATKFCFKPSEEELAVFSTCVKHWPPFEDSTKALKALQTKYKLCILSNIDDDLFAFSAQNLQVNFDTVFTAQLIGSYKPSLQNFQFAVKHLGLPKERILHVAQSLFHDIVPAKKLGLATVWLNRREGKEGFGATPAAEAKPDFEVPDLQSLVDLIGTFKT